MDKLNALADVLREAATRHPVVAEARRRHLRRQQERGRQDAGPVFDEMSKSVEATIAHVRDECVGEESRDGPAHVSLGSEPARQRRLRGDCTLRSGR